MRPVVEHNVRDGCHAPDPCLSGPCPEHSVCTDAWEQHQCKCDPGEGTPSPLCLCTSLVSERALLSSQHRVCALDVYREQAYPLLAQWVQWRRSTEL